MKVIRTVLPLLLLVMSFTSSAAIVAEDYEYRIGDMVFKGYVARNTRLEQSLGTVLIVHDWDGPNAYERGRAEQLAALGYTAFAIDVYGRDRQPTSMRENQQRAGEMYANRDVFRARLLAAVDEVSRIPGGTDNIVVMGYCFGGAAALELARAGAPLRGFVSFHGGLNLPEGQDYSETQGAVLVLHGSADPVSGMTDLATLLDDLNRANVRHDAHVYGGALHSFTVPWSSDYDLDADRKSWNSLLTFLNEVL
ncbi:MAG: dienelactone hydrolase family protein [Idiomarina sp.]|nr:dienelactone hydrolase family protein [Idiomarina sp.]